MIFSYIKMIHIIHWICQPLQSIGDFFSDIWQVLINVRFDYTVLASFSAMLAGFISITVPVALSIVSKHTDEYKDKEISDSFLNESSYWYQVYVIPLLVVFAMISFSAKLSQGWLVYLILIVDLFSFYVFVRFLHVVGQYATNFDTYYIDRLKNDSDEIVQKES